MANKGIYLIVSTDTPPGTEDGTRNADLVIADNMVAAQQLVAYAGPYRQIVQAGQVGTYDPSMEGLYLTSALVDWHVKGGRLALDMSGMRGVLGAIAQAD